MGSSILKRIIKDGKPDGVMSEWHENGKLKMDMNLKNGKRDGLLRVWHQNGQLKAKGQFKDDKAVGKHLYCTRMGN